jgi:hypothetical protein
MSESLMPVNNISSGSIEKVDPIMTAKPMKRLRDIIGPTQIKKEIGKDKSRGV